MSTDPHAFDSWSTPQLCRATGFILPPESEVDCPCDPSLHRPVLRDHTGCNDRVSACLRCGKVSLTETLVEEPHPHDVRCVGNRIQALAPKLLAWLSAWPRLAWGVWQQDRKIYLPASLRCRSAAELAACEQRFLAQQKNQSAAERLLSVGIPTDPPPAGLPGHLQTFAQTLAGVRLGADADMKTLLAHADRTDWAMPFAYEHLKKRSDFTAVVVGLLTSPDSDRRSRGINLVQFGRLNDPAIVAALIALLQAANREPDLIFDGQTKLHTLLDTFSGMGSAGAAARPVLREIAAKIGDGDYYLRQRVEQVCDLIQNKNQG